MKYLEKISLLIHKVTKPKYFLLFCLLITFVFSYYGFNREATLFISSSITTLLIVIILKKITDTKRPSDAKVKDINTGFPSGHSAVAMCLAIIFSHFLQEFEIRNADLLSDLLIVLAILVGISRLILRVHTFLQVIAGLLIGALIPLFFTLLY